MRSAPLPPHFRQKVPQGNLFFQITKTLSDFKLNTVCEEAKCPNRSECYSRGTLTFQILGNVCTRRCNFCAENTGRPQAVDLSETERLLEAVKRLQLTHVVITAPARDDLADGGATIFANSLALLRKHSEKITVEILISDLGGCEQSLQTVLESQPDIFNHNIETVRRLTPAVRAKATYDRSLAVLRFSSRYLNRGDSSRKTQVKSGLMVGLGEIRDELLETFYDLRSSGVNYLTVGQYLQPSSKHLAIQKFYSLEEFKELEKSANGFGFEKIFCGPRVRSSYHAEEMIDHV